MEWEYEIKFRIFNFAILRRKPHFRNNRYRNWTVAWHKKLAPESKHRYWTPLFY